MLKIAVTNRSLPKLPEARRALIERYRGAEIRFNDDDIHFDDPERLIDFVSGCGVAVIGLDRFSEAVIGRLPDLKVISCCSVGVDHIEPAVLAKHGIRLGWKAGVNKRSVAELTVGLMIDLLRGTNAYNIGLRGGDWPSQRTGRLLQGRTVGIHGCGNIGQELVSLLQPFDARILVCDRVDLGGYLRRNNLTQVDPDTLWREAEILTIHLPRNSSTSGLYDRSVLEKLRPGAVLINTARGGIVDEAALLEGLKGGRIAGAAFDVFAVEPSFQPALFGLANFIATPHIAGSAIEARLALAFSAIDGIEDNAVPEPGVYPFD